MDEGFIAEFGKLSRIATLWDFYSAHACRYNRQSSARIGLHLGNAMVEGSGGVYGESVNVAACLEALADPGGILISSNIYERSHWQD